MGFDTTKAVGSKWVFKKNIGLTVQLRVTKARLVTQESLHVLIALSVMN